MVAIVPAAPVGSALVASCLSDGMATSRRHKKNRAKRDYKSCGVVTSVVSPEYKIDLEDAKLGRLTFRDMLSHASELIRDAQGVRYILAMLRHVSDADQQCILDVVVPETVELAGHAHGHQVIVEFFMLGNEEYSRALLAQLRGLVTTLAQRPLGSYILRMAVRFCAALEECVQLIRELEDCIIDCFMHPHAASIIVACIQRFECGDLEFVLDAVSGASRFQMQQIMASRCGTLVIEALIIHCPKEFLADILSQVIAMLPTLLTIDNGNCIVQQVLRHGRQEDKQRILKEIAANLFKYATDPVSVGTVQQCLDRSGMGDDLDSLLPEFRLLTEAMYDIRMSQDVPVLLHLALDKTGSEVVHHMLECSAGEAQKRLLRALLDKSERLEASNCFGRSVLTSARLYFIEKLPIHFAMSGSFACYLSISPGATLQSARLQIARRLGIPALSQHILVDGKKVAEGLHVRDLHELLASSSERTIAIVAVTPSSNFDQAR